MPIKPFKSEILQLADGSSVYWEASGNPKGKPALYLHGGPGSGLLTGYRQHFDPERYLIVSLDQRGCGRSRPLVTDPGYDLRANTTQSLIADIELLREYLGIERWLITGLSWGTTLALAYAQTHPERVTEIVLGAVTTTSRAEVTWLTETIGCIFPEPWTAFEQTANRRPGENVIDAYYRLIRDPNRQIREQAAEAWCKWEDVIVSLDPQAKPSARFADPNFRINFATLVIHYFANAAFLEGQEILKNMGRIAHLPGVLIHGRLDVSGPLSTAWQLHQRWSGSQLVVVETEGHGGPVMIKEFAKAIAGFADE
ncbi:MAG: prolyl aminopeptidase [Verrucomicrobia bacterium]|nr:prolyl aminopeptidase [Verrucomicrobiota bacterium]